MDKARGCPTNFSLSSVGFRASHLPAGFGSHARQTKVRQISPACLVHTSSDSTKREVVEFLAALVGLEVCELMFATSVPPVFGDILQIQR